MTPNPIRTIALRRAAGIRRPRSQVSPGMAGTALTTLRPSGKARFGDHVVDVVTEGEFIPAETAVTVVSTDGMRVVVKASA